jgi:uncharacterized protein YerC
MCQFGGSMAATNTITKKKLTAAQRRPQAVEMRKRGFSYRVIGQRLGVSHTTAFNDVRRALQDLNKKASLEAVEMRRLVMERIEWAIHALRKDVQAGNEKAIGRLVQLNAQIIDLYGLKEPETSVHLLLDEDVLVFLQENDLSMSDVVRAFNDMLRKKHLALQEGT